MPIKIKNALLCAILALQILFCFFPSVIRKSAGDVSSCSVIIEDCLDTEHDPALERRDNEYEIKSKCSSLAAINIIFLTDAVITLIVCGIFCQKSVSSSILMLLSNIMLGIILPLANVSCLPGIFEALNYSSESCEFSLTTIGAFQIILALFAVIAGIIPSVSSKSKDTDMNHLSEGKVFVSPSLR